MTRKSLFSFDFEPIFKLDYSIATRRPLKCMYMPMWSLRRRHNAHVRVWWYRAQISAQYSWARTFKRARMDV
jgi:hypothetical protein